MADYREQTNRIGTAGRAMMDFVDELDRVTRMSCSGISMIRAVPQSVKAVAQATGELDETYEAKLAQAEKMAQFAEQEVGSGFPILFGHAAVGFWSALEATMSRMATFWLCDSLIAVQKLSASSLRLPVATFLQSSKEVLMGHVVEEILASCPDGRGIGKFEFLLDRIGLGGGFDDEMRKTLFELSQVRNLVVHQMSIVDDKFKRNCPWIDVPVGSRFAVTRRRCSDYHKATVSYLTEVILRAVSVARNVERTEVDNELSRESN